MIETTPESPKKASTSPVAGLQRCSCTLPLMQYREALLEALKEVVQPHEYAYYQNHLRRIPISKFEEMS